MGRYLGHPFAAGGMDNNVHVEKYDFDLRKWKNLGKKNLLNRNY